MSVNKQEEIKKLREQGFNLFRLPPNSKTPNIEWKKYQTEKYDSIIPMSFNYAVVCGYNNLVVLDLDNLELFKDFEEFKDKTFVVKTGKGYHFYFKHNNSKLPNTIHDLRNDKGQKIDVQSAGAFVVGPGSIHPDTKKEYEVISNKPVLDIDFHLVTKKIEQLGFNFNSSKKPITEIVKGVNEGNRNDSAFKFACYLLDTKKLDTKTALYELKQWNHINEPPLHESELRTVFESALKQTKDSKNPKHDPEEVIKQNRELYNFARGKIKRTIASKSDSNQIFAKIENNSHIETIDLNSGKARSWLLFNYKQETEKLCPSDSYKNALDAIKADALFDGTVKEVIYTRIAQQEGIIYYDLCSPTWELLKITKEGIKKIPYDENSPTFVRKQSMNEQTKPISENRDGLEELVKLLRIKQSDRLIFKVHITSLFFEKHQTPIMVIHGEHGSIKTTITKTIKRLVDPSASNIASLPTHKDDIPLSFSNKYLSVFDNVSELKQNVSDMFCRAITGEETTKRQLYTDADEYIFNYKRKIILNGISPRLDSPDFNDRAIFYETGQIPDNERLTEEEFNQKLDELLPHVLGQVFTILSKTLGKYDVIGKTLKPFSRMGEFEKYGETISQILGYKPKEFLDNYHEKWKNSSTNVTEAYPIFNLIRDLVKDVKHFEDSVANLHKKLKTDAKERDIEIKGKESGFPSKPNILSKQIKQLNPVFRKEGFDIRIEPYTSNDGKYPRNNRVVYITNRNLTTKPQKNLENTLD